MNDNINSGTLHPRALDPSIFAGAPSLDCATLTVVAFTLEAERERLRPGLGKGGYHPRGFVPRTTDVVDTMTWEDLLQRPGVVERCASGANTKASDVLEMVRKHCEPSNPDTFFWMWAYYLEQESGNATAIKVGLTVARSQKAYLERQAAAQRQHKAGKAGAARKTVAATAEKAAKLQQIWIHGNFDTKAQCIEQEAAALGLPLSTAQKALRGICKKAART